MAKKDAEKRTLDGDILNLMRKAGWIRSDGFTLRDGFAGQWDIEAVIPTRTRNSDEDNNFSLQCSTPLGKITLPGSVLVNARVLSVDKITEDSIKGAAGVYYQDAIQSVLAGSRVFNQVVEMNDEDYTFPKSINVVGASVIKDQDNDHPRMPLRKYKYHTEVSNHHRGVVADEAAYVTKDAFKTYLAAEGDNRPKGVPAHAVELETQVGVDTGKMENWGFTFLLGDMSED